MRLKSISIIIFAVLSEAVSKLPKNHTNVTITNNLKDCSNDTTSTSLEARRAISSDDVSDEKKKKKKERSTSSSSGEIKQDSGDSKEKKESLELTWETETSSSDSTKKKNKYKPKSSAERKGWRKWHRKCTPCPEDINMKWRDPSIKWICGAYQRARRSFKSLCMMHYRNCQDGTMFLKIHDHRCKNDTPGDTQPHGDHFFYDYRVVLSADSSSSSESESKDISSHVDSISSISGEG